MLHEKHLTVLVVVLILFFLCRVIGGCLSCRGFVPISADQDMDKMHLKSWIPKIIGVSCLPVKMLLSVKLRQGNQKRPHDNRASLFPASHQLLSIKTSRLCKASIRLFVLSVPIA